MAEASSNSDPLPKPPTDRSLPTAASSDKRLHPRFKIEGTTVAIGKPGILASLGLGPIRHPVINLSAGGAMASVMLATYLRMVGGLAHFAMPW